MAQHIVNKNTRQDPVDTGLTGAQVVKFIHADRVYIKAADVTATPTGEKSDGVTPMGWTDLGIVNGPVKITYSKTKVEVRTGIDEVLRDIYNTKKTASFQFDLSQVDDVVLGAVFGTAGAHITGSPSSGSVGAGYRFKIGKEDVVTKALLLVSQNKLDGKEWQFYNPAAFITFELKDSSGELVMTVTGDCPVFATDVDGEEAAFYMDIYE